MLHQSDGLISLEELLLERVDLCAVETFEGGELGVGLGDLLTQHKVA